jgi:hypothetical protein
VNLPNAAQRQRQHAGDQCRQRGITTVPKKFSNHFALPLFIARGARAANQ